MRRDPATQTTQNNHSGFWSNFWKNLFGSQVTLKVPEGMVVKTQVPYRNPEYAAWINLFIPLVVLIPGILALLAQVGVISGAAILASTPFGIGVLVLAGALAAVAWLSPMIVRWYRNRVNPIDSAKTSSEPLYEVKPKIFGPTVVSGLSWDLRVTMAAAGFALLAVIITLMALNPAGLVTGTAILQLIELSPIPLALAATLGTIVGFVVGTKYRDFALWWTQRRAKKIEGTDVIDPDELMIVDNGPERSIFRGSKHSLFIGGSVMGGLFLGTTVAVVVSLFTGGISVLPFSAISLGVMGFVIAYPYLSAAWDKVLARFGYKRAWKYDESNDKLVAAKEAVRVAVRNGNDEQLKTAVEALNTVVDEIKKAKDTEPNQETRIPIISGGLDFPFWFNLFLGLAIGLSFAAMFGSFIGPLTIIVAPIVCAALAVLSPAFFKLAKPVLKRMAKALGLDNHKHQHATGDITWSLRLFNGTSAAAALMGACVALGSGFLVAGIVAGAVILLSLASPTLFAIWRNLSPNTAPVPNLSQDVDKKPKGFLQWHIRLVLGTIFASLATIAFPVVGPYLIIACAIAFVALPPLFAKLSARLWPQPEAPKQTGDAAAGTAPGVADDKERLASSSAAAAASSAAAAAPPAPATANLGFFAAAAAPVPPDALAAAAAPGASSPLTVS